MKLLWQPAETEARDYREIDSADWHKIEANPDKTPVGTGPGASCNSILVQGIVFDDADHYYVEHLLSGGCRVWSWWDDPEIWNPIEFRARVVTLRHLAPDPVFGGAWNTNQQEVWYGQPGGSVETRFLRDAPWSRVTFKPWEKFYDDLPAGNVLHGIMLPDPLWVAAQQARKLRGWREWNEGVDPACLDVLGRVEQQNRLGLRPPKDGTRHRFASNTNGAVAGHTLAQEKTTLEDTASASNLSYVIAKTSAGTVDWGWNFGGSLDGGTHPNGLYRQQLDVTVNDGGMSFGIKTINSVTGHFCIWNNIGGSHTASFEQAEGTHTGSGLTMCSRTINPTDGDEFDVFQTILVIDHPAGHGGGDHTFTLQLNEADDFIEGPWSAITKTDTRGGRIHGIANVTSERGGRIQGVASANSEIGGRIDGQTAATNATSERGGRIQGVDQATSERGGRIHGIDQATSEIGGRIDGTDSAQSEVGGRIHGIDQATAEVGGRVHGFDSANAEIGGRVEGTDSASSEAGGRIHGADSASAEIGGRVEGTDSAAAEIGGRLHGQDTANDEIGGRVQGVDSAQSERGGRVEGTDSASGEVGGRVHGIDQATGEIGGRVEGVDQAAGEIGGRIQGVDQATNERGGRVHGRAVASAEIGGRVQGAATASSEIGARIEGQSGTIAKTISLSLRRNSSSAFPMRRTSAAAFEESRSKKVGLTAEK